MAGKRNAGNKRPSMFEVAKLAGVSHQTVSRVINHSPDVSDATREKVQKAIDQLMENDWLGTDRLMVVRDNWLEQEQMHLDTYFNCIDRDLVTLSANRYKAGPDSSQYLTVDVYERKDGRYSRTVEGACFVDLLEKTLGVKVIPISRPDELNYANNYLTIGPRRIMAVAGQSQELQQALAAHGVDVTWIPLPNLTRGYGAAHCMTQILGTEEVF